MEKSTPRKTEILDFEKVWLMFQETDKKFQEMKIIFKELKSQFINLKSIFEEAQSTTISQSENRIFQFPNFSERTNKIMQELEHDYDMELLKENIQSMLFHDIFKSWDIKILSSFMSSTISTKGILSEMEHINLGLSGENLKQVILFDVVEKLNKESILYFLENLNMYAQYQKMNDKKEVFGAVVYLTVEEKADKFAAKNGLFVIEATNKSARIRNRETFKPKIW